MKVLFIAPLYDRVNGMSLASEVFLEGLIKNHHQPLIVNLAKSKQAKRKFFGFFTRLKEGWLIFQSLLSQKNKAELMYFTISESVLGNLKDLLVLLLCRRYWNRCILHLHGGSGMKNILSHRHPWLKKINLYFLNRVAAIAVLGKSHVSIYHEVTDQSKIHIVPNFAEKEFFSNSDAIEQKFQHPQPLKILMLSNFLPGKGQEEVLQAFLRLDPKTQAKIEIDFAGDILKKEQKKLFCKKIAAFPQLRYHGIVRGEQKKQLLHQAHLFCLPTYYASEGQPISILEAYASGCAVMVTTHAGIGDIFANQVNGIEVEKRSSESIMHGIHEALKDKSALKAMAHRNLEMAKKYYTVETYHARLLSLLKDCSTRPV